MHDYFASTPPENSGGAENLAEKSGPDSKKFFCYMYEYSLRHPVWVAEINVRACNSVQSILILNPEMQKKKKLQFILLYPHL